MDKIARKRGRPASAPHMPGDTENHVTPKESKSYPTEPRTRDEPSSSIIAKVFRTIFRVSEKWLYIDIWLKICLYAILIISGSYVCGYLPDSYFSDKRNALNKYFVKIGWLWTILTMSVFMGLTSSIYCCGNKIKIIQHMSRILIATIFWWVLTTAFVEIEGYTGRCILSATNETLVDKFVTKSTCVKAKMFWTGFDISGHAFLLIYSSLIIKEEVRCFQGWDRIGDLLTIHGSVKHSLLTRLSPDELSQLRRSYYTNTPYLKGVFVFIAILTVLWDLMLISTVLYFHSFWQKLVGATIAVITWYLTYRQCFKARLIGLPGEGLIDYRTEGSRRIPGLITQKRVGISTEQIEKITGTCASDD